MARRWKVLLTTSVVAFMAMLDVTIVNIAFPDIRGSFPDDSLADLSWVINAYAIVFAAALVPAGRLADRFGRKRLFLLGTGLFLAASVACGLAVSTEMLVAARAVQALGGAILIPTSLGLVLPEFPIQQRALATSLWTATGAVAAATGPSLGGVLVDWGGWRWVFFVNLVVGLPALLPARRLLHEHRDEQATGLPDVAGTLLIVAGVGALALGIVKGEEWGWASAPTVGSLAAAALLLVVFTAWSARHPRPVIDLRLFRIRSFAAANAGSFVFSVGFFAVLLSNVLFLTSVWDYSILGAGLALTPAPLMAAVAAPVSGRLADRFGQRAVAIPGNLMFATGPLVFAFTLTAEPDYWTAFLPPSLVTGFGIGLALPAFSSAAVAELPRNLFATGVAVNSFFRQLGAVVGIAVLVAVLSTAASGQALEGYQRGWTMVAASGLVAAAIAVTLGRVRARHVEAPAIPAGQPAGERTTTRP